MTTAVPPIRPPKWLILSMLIIGTCLLVMTMFGCVPDNSFKDADSEKPKDVWGKSLHKANVATANFGKKRK